MDIHISLKPEIIAHVLGLPISNSLILSLLTAVLLCGVGFFAVRRLQRVPGRIQNGAEIVVDGILDPTALILSGAMMLDHLGEKTAGDRVRRAVEAVLCEGISVTADINPANHVSTPNFAHAVIAKF